MSNNQVVVICSGKTSQKYFCNKGEKVEVTPFVYSCGSELGVGYSEFNYAGVENSWAWGLISPHLLIQSWRAMKLLEVVPIIDNASLCRSWYLGREKLSSHEEDYLDKEAAMFGSYIKFLQIRADILAQFPTDEELLEMLVVIRANGIKILESEVERERAELAPPHVILGRLREFDVVRRERFRKEEELKLLMLSAIKETLPPKPRWWQ